TAAISRTGPDLTTMVLDIVTAQLNDGGSGAHRASVRQGQWLPKDQYYERGNRGAGRSLGILGRKIRRVPRGATRRGHRGRLPRGKGDSVGLWPLLAARRARHSQAVGS